MHRLVPTLGLAAGVAVLAARPVSMAGQAPPRGDTLLARLTAEALAANPALRGREAAARAAAARVGPADEPSGSGRPARDLASSL